MTETAGKETTMDGEATTTERQQGKSQDTAPRLTMRQRDRARELDHANAAAQEACRSEFLAADSWSVIERRKLDGEMSSRIRVADREQSANVVAARWARSVAFKQIEEDHRRAISAANTARNTARWGADAALAGVISEGARKFSEASAPVEEWYAAEKARIATEAGVMRAAAEAKRDAVVAPLRAELEAIEKGSAAPKEGA